GALIVAASLERREVGDELVDLLGLEVLAVGVRHERGAAGRVHGARHEVRARLDDGLADVALGVLGLSLVFGGPDDLLGARADAGEARTGHVDPRRDGVAGGAGRRGSAEERLALGDRAALGADRAGPRRLLREGVV